MSGANESDITTGLPDLKGRFHYPGAGVPIVGPGKIHLGETSLLLEGLQAQRRTLMVKMKSMAILFAAIVGASLPVAFLKISMGISDTISFAIFAGIAGACLPMILRGGKKSQGDEPMLVEIPYSLLEKIHENGLSGILTLSFLQSDRKTYAQFFPSVEASHFIQEANARAAG